MSEPTRNPSPSPGSRRPDDDAGAREEKRLAAAIARGDSAAFESVFRTYYDRLHHFAQRFVRSPEIAEELVENVLVRLWERRGEGEIRGSLRSYLYTAVRNRALMYLEHQDVVRRTHDAAVRSARSPGMGEPPPAADDELHASELARAVRDAVERLPDRPREAYVLHREHGLSYPEIAEVMSIHRKTVEIHIGRALRALREELADFLS